MVAVIRLLHRPTRMVCVPGHLGVFSFNCSARGFMLRGPKYMLTQISTGPCGARSRPPLTGGISTGACTLVVAWALTCACDLAHLGSESGGGARLPGHPLR